MQPEEILYEAASSLCMILTAVYVFRASAGKEHSGQTCDTKEGPFASLIPLVGILLSSHYRSGLCLFAILPAWRLYEFHTVAVRVE